LIGGAEGDRTPGPRSRTAKWSFYGPPKKLAMFVKTPNKNAAANKISTATNYDCQILILSNFGNGLATGKASEIICFDPYLTSCDNSDGGHYKSMEEHCLLAAPVRHGRGLC
jgi:hypothetical protein